MLIKCINHASFVVLTADVKLLVDPWLFGSAFNNGWNLITKTNIEDSYWNDVTHLWFSHEHPDHFNIPSLNHLKKYLPSSVIVLFQKTRDQRVKSYCEKIGLNVQELTNNKVYTLGSETQIRIGQVPFYDSWIHIKTPTASVVNLNDCVLNKAEQFERIKKKCGDIDVLMMQFGYANWEGNPEEVTRQKESSRKKLQRIILADKILSPKFTIPNASFSVFTHTENFYLNNHNSSIEETVELIKDKCGSTPLLLSPGQEFDVNKSIADVPRLTSESIKTYGDSLTKWELPKNEHSPAIAEEKIIESINSYIDRIKNKNNFFLIRVMSLLGFFEEIYFYIRDLDKLLTFSQVKGYKFESIPYTPEKHILLSSDSLNFIFANEFGLDTLLVNGRFRATRQLEKKLFKTFGVGSLNNMGYAFNFILPFKFSFVLRVLKIILKF